MAVQILNVGEYGATLEPGATDWSAPLVRVELEYEDTTNILSLVRVINNSAQDVLVVITRTSDGRTLERRFGPGTTTQALPQQASQRVNFVPYPGGKWSGFRVEFIHPAP